VARRKSKVEGHCFRPARPRTLDIRPSTIYEILYRHYGPQHWWPAQSRWEMMVGAILTQNTAWTNVERAISALKTARILSVKQIADVPRRRLEKLIRPSGYFRQKAKRLQLFAKALLHDKILWRALCGSDRRNGGTEDRSLPSPRRPSDAPTLRTRLLAMHGIGPETADSILLYAGGFPVFVVDAYTRRLGQRLGLFKTDDYHDVQQFFVNGLGRKGTPKIYNEFHALIVRHAKEVCKGREPKCEICTLADVCEYGRKAIPSPGRCHPLPRHRGRGQGQALAPGLLGGEGTDRRVRGRRHLCGS
jgi:endonuclease III related protein